MPGIDGYEVLRRLRAAPPTRDVPAIAVSANAMPQDLARGQAAGFADYLTKPLELQRLLSALRAALPGWTAGPP
jgi:CheY-like chemotaxis protein